jgi:MoxR-like ATPase
VTQPQRRTVKFRWNTDDVVSPYTANPYFPDNYFQDPKDSINMKNILTAALMTPGRHGWGTPLLIDGMPGAGKTAIGEQIARSLGLVPFVLIGSQIEAPDIGGYPCPGERYGKRCLDFLAAYWLVEANHICETTDNGVALILDELNTSSGPVQAAMLRVINERRAGGVALHPRIRIICFMNPAEIAAEAGGNPIAPAMANRMGHVKWQPPSVSEWSNHLMQVSSGAEEDAPANARLLEDAMLETWNTFFVPAAGEVTAFLQAHSARANEMPTKSEDRHGAFPTFRTWELATRALASGRYHRMGRGEQMEFVGSFVGDSVAKELFKYLAAKDIPDAADWLAGNVTLDLKVKTRADVVATVLRTAVALLQSTTDVGLFIDRLAFLMKWFTKEGQDHSDLVSGPMRQTFGVWRKRASNDASIQKKLLDAHRETVRAFRAIPLLARLEDIGVLPTGTAQR